MRRFYDNEDAGDLGMQHAADASAALAEDGAEVSRVSSTLDVVEFCCRHGIPADVVGRWVWVRFAEKPSAEVRALLKRNGFRWVQGRGEWAHACGIHSRRGHGNPRDKYGVLSVEEARGARE